MVNDVKKQDIGMMKALANPPQKVAAVCMAVCLTLDPNASPKEMDWKKCIKMMKNPLAFIEVLLKFDATKFPPNRLVIIKKILVENDIISREDTVKVKACSLAAASLHSWILNLID